MKNSRYFLIVAMLVSLLACKQEKVYNQIVKDEVTGKDMYVGYVTVEGLKGEIFRDAYIRGLNEYVAHDSTVQAFKLLLNDVTFRVIMGTWCSDSDEEVPRFLNILYNAEYDVLNPANFELICVDRDKKAPGIKVAKYKAEKIPTFIVYRKGKEIGRIVERFKSNPETDLLEILKK